MAGAAGLAAQSICAMPTAASGNAPGMVSASGAEACAGEVKAKSASAAGRNGFLNILRQCAATAYQAVRRKGYRRAKGNRSDERRVGKEWVRTCKYRW